MDRATLIAYEAIRYRYARSWIRSHRGEFTIEEVLTNSAIVDEQIASR